MYESAFKNRVSTVYTIREQTANSRPLEEILTQNDTPVLGLLESLQYGISYINSEQTQNISQEFKHHIMEHDIISILQEVKPMIPGIFQWAKEKYKPEHNMGTQVNPNNKISQINQNDKDSNMDNHNHNNNSGTPIVAIIPELTVHEISSIRLYTLSHKFHLIFNRVLTQHQSYIPVFLPYIKLLHGAVKKLPRQEMVVYKVSHQPFESAIGSNFICSSFVSATPSMNTSQWFSINESLVQPRFVMQIHGRTCVNVQAFSSQGEPELMFSPDTHLQVKSVSLQQTGTSFVAMEEYKCDPSMLGGDSFTPNQKTSTSEENVARVYVIGSRRQTKEEAVNDNSNSSINTDTNYNQSVDEGNTCKDINDSDDNIHTNDNSSTDNPNHSNLGKISKPSTTDTTDSNTEANPHTHAQCDTDIQIQSQSSTPSSTTTDTVFFASASLQANIKALLSLLTTNTEPHHLCSVLPQFLALYDNSELWNSALAAQPNVEIPWIDTYNAITKSITLYENQPDTLSYIIGCLAYLSRVAEIKLLTEQHGYAQICMKLLKEYPDHINTLVYTCWCLASMMSNHHHRVRYTLMTNGAMELVLHIGHRHKDNAMVQTIVCSCIAMWSFYISTVEKFSGDDYHITHKNYNNADNNHTDSDIKDNHRTYHPITESTPDVNPTDIRNKIYILGGLDILLRNIISFPQQSKLQGFVYYALSNLQIGNTFMQNMIEKSGVYALVNLTVNNHSTDPEILKYICTCVQQFRLTETVCEGMIKAGTVKKIIQGIENNIHEAMLVKFGVLWLHAMVRECCPYMCDELGIIPILKNIIGLCLSVELSTVRNNDRNEDCTSDNNSSNRNSNNGSPHINTTDTPPPAFHQQSSNNDTSTNTIEILFYAAKTLALICDRGTEYKEKVINSGMIEVCFTILFTCIGMQKMRQMNEDKKKSWCSSSNSGKQNNSTDMIIESKENTKSTSENKNPDGDKSYSHKYYDNIITETTLILVHVTKHEDCYAYMSTPYHTKILLASLSTYRGNSHIVRNILEVLAVLVGNIEICNQIFDSHLYMIDDSNHLGNCNDTNGNDSNKTIKTDTVTHTPDSADTSGTTNTATISTTNSTTSAPSTATNNDTCDTKHNNTQTAHATSLKATNNYITTHINTHTTHILDLFYIVTYEHIQDAFCPQACVMFIDHVNNSGGRTKRGLERKQLIIQKNIIDVFLLLLHNIMYDSEDGQVMKILSTYATNKHTSAAVLHKLVHNNLAQHHHTNATITDTSLHTISSTNNQNRNNTGISDHHSNMSPTPSHMTNNNNSTKIGRTYVKAGRRNISNSSSSNGKNHTNNNNTDNNHNNYGSTTPNNNTTNDNHQLVIPDYGPVIDHDHYNNLAFVLDSMFSRPNQLLTQRHGMKILHQIFTTYPALFPLIDAYPNRYFPSPVSPDSSRPSPLLAHIHLILNTHPDLPVGLQTVIEQLTLRK